MTPRQPTPRATALRHGLLAALLAFSTGSHAQAGPAATSAVTSAATSTANAGASPTSPQAADAADERSGRFCSATTRNLHQSCQHEAADDFLRARALCLNLTLAHPRALCQAEAVAQQTQGLQACEGQRRARRDLCGQLGEARYDPAFAPADFETDFVHPARPNPYFPLLPGQRWRYVGGDETIDVEVKARIKSVRGVPCIVVHDRVEQDGQPVEDTEDWFALRRDGSVVYCGEISRNYEIFEGDRPPRAELVDVDGSWKAGRDGDLPGLQFPALPSVGAVYRQEFSPGNAEDAAMILSTAYGPGQPGGLDGHVPPALVQLLCSANDCIVTGEFTPLSPGAFERKYYARGIGLFLEVDPHDGSTVQLVACNVDPRCAGLAALTAR